MPSPLPPTPRNSGSGEIWVASGNLRSEGGRASPGAWQIWGPGWRGGQRSLQDRGGDGRLLDVREEGAGVSGTSRKGEGDPPNSTTPIEDRDWYPSKPRVSEG